ncbi:WS/DGAT domain-containing protein, partial [Salmonella enterica]|uniref:WS/DGAT domain-containing protein n=1 Tax=Salmonella enterica TaxID=28901 RepID=UPI003CEA0A0F
HPIARYERIRELTSQVKRSDLPAGATSIVDVAGVVPPVLHTSIARSLFGTRLFNVTVTNVPGPQTTLYAFGS